MRSLFGLSQENLLFGLGLATLAVVGVLGAAAWRNPLLLRLAWRNVPRRPGFAVLITLGLTIGIVPSLGGIGSQTGAPEVGLAVLGFVVMALRGRRFSVAGAGGT